MEKKERFSREYAKLVIPFNKTEKELFIRSHVDIDRCIYNNYYYDRVFKNIKKEFIASGLTDIYDNKDLFGKRRPLTDTQWNGLIAMVIDTLMFIGESDKKNKIEVVDRTLISPINISLTLLVKLIDYHIGQLFYVDEIEYALWWLIHESAVSTLLCGDVGGRVYTLRYLYEYDDELEYEIEKIPIDDLQDVFVYSNDKFSIDKHYSNLISNICSIYDHDVYECISDEDDQDEFGWLPLDILSNLPKRLQIFAGLDEDDERDSDIYYSILRQNTNVLNKRLYNKLVNKYTYV